MPTAEALAKKGPIWMLGRKPLRIAMLTEISGVTWGQAWRGRTSADVDGLKLPVLGRADLVANKRASGRPKDLRDVEALERFAAARPKPTKPRKRRRPR